MNKRHPIIKSRRDRAAAYEKGYGPFRQMLKDLKLPMRYPRGDLRNENRVLAVNLAQMDMKAAIGRRVRK